MEKEEESGHLRTLFHTSYFTLYPEDLDSLSMVEYYISRFPRNLECTENVRYKRFHSQFGRCDSYTDLTPSKN